MLEEITKLIGLETYTDKGMRLGVVENIRIDVTERVIDGLYFGETNPQLVEGGISITVPYRWVQSVGEVIILKYFPERVVLPPEMAGASPEQMEERYPPEER